MIEYKSNAEIDAMRPSCTLAAQTLVMISEHVVPGVSTEKLNKICHEFILDNGAIPAPLNYRGFPKSICTSVNEVVCHGIPDEKHVLADGDIINIDVTTILNGYHGDTSDMFFVGEVAESAKRLCEITERSMLNGIEAVSDGGHVGDIGFAIQTYAEKYGYSVVREFVGHGIGKVFHEEPQIYHYGKKGKGVSLKKGMVFTIEPMINEGHWKTKVLRDGWTAITVDKKLSAQYEHTIAILEDGSVDILTSREDLK